MAASCPPSLYLPPPKKKKKPTPNPPGVVEAMIGMKVGDSRSPVIMLPDSEEFQPAALRGANIQANIKLNELFEFDLPQVGACVGGRAWDWGGWGWRVLSAHGRVGLAGLRETGLYVLLVLCLTSDDAMKVAGSGHDSGPG